MTFRRIHLARLKCAVISVLEQKPLGDIPDWPSLHHRSSGSQECPLRATVVRAFFKALPLLMSIVLALVAFHIAYAQNARTPSPFGRPRVTINPMPNGLNELIAAELLRQHVPVQVAAPHTFADCIVALLPEAMGENATPADQRAGLTQTMIMLDVRSRLIIWEETLNPKRDSSKLTLRRERRLAAHVASSINKSGAYCGGSAYSAPTQDMEDRVRVFKPPTFNW